MLHEGELSTEWPDVRVYADDMAGQPRTGPCEKAELIPLEILDRLVRGQQQ